MSMYAVVMAGGSGTRLWPASRRDRPKQLLPLLGDRSLLQDTVARLDPAVAADRVIVVAGRAHVAEVRAQLPQVPAAQIVGEPEPLGTAAAVGLGAALVAARDPGATMVVLPADHVIAPTDRFHADLVRADVAARSGRLVTFGIVPTAPETGFGYIEVADRLPDAGGALRVVRYIEKPPRDAAEAYVAGGRHLWNSGMFAWTVSAIEGALRALLPGVARCMDAVREAEARGDELEAAVVDAWRLVTERTTIDYGVMERAGGVACVPASFRWSDVGSWAALGDVLPSDEHRNAVVGRHVGVDTTDCVVHAAAGRLVATVGVEGLVIVDAGDAVLVCRRDRAQDVRAVVDRLAADEPQLL